MELGLEVENMILMVKSMVSPPLILVAGGPYNPNSKRKVRDWDRKVEKSLGHVIFLLSGPKSLSFPWNLDCRPPLLRVRIENNSKLRFLLVNLLFYFHSLLLMWWGTSFRILSFFISGG